MKSTTAFSLLFLTVSQLTGVYLPRPELKCDREKGQLRRKTFNYNLDKRVEIFPLTPGLIEKLRPTVSKSQANPNLDEQIKTGNTVLAQATS